MEKLKINQKGFGAIGVVLILVVVALIGTSAWLIYKNHHKAKVVPVSTAAVTNTNTKTVQTIPDPYSGWKIFSDTSGHITLKYPPKWVTVSHPELCGSGIFLVAPDQNSIGTCGSENIGEIEFAWAANDSAICPTFDAGAYANITNENATVSGLTATKQTATAKPTNSDGLGLLPDGTQVVSYCFAANGINYNAVYYQQPTYPNVLNDFNAIVTKTLKIN